MTTAKQAAANQANSQKSTGARTPEGKAAVAKNALKHGLLSQRLILAGEDAQDYEALLAGLMRSVAPEGMLEQVLVEKVAVALWRQKRLVAAESAYIEIGRKPRSVFGGMEFLGVVEVEDSKEDIELERIKNSAPVQIEVLARYSVGLDNELYRAIEAIRKQQEFRLKNASVELEAEAA
jgi:hypothetical protein